MPSTQKFQPKHLVDNGSLPAQHGALWPWPFIRPVKWREIWLTLINPAMTPHTEHPYSTLNSKQRPPPNPSSALVSHISGNFLKETLGIRGFFRPSYSTQQSHATKKGQFSCFVAHCQWAAVVLKPKPPTMSWTSGLRPRRKVHWQRIWFKELRERSLMNDYKYSII